MNMNMEIAKLVIRGIVLIITGYLVPAAKAWLECKAEDAKMERLKEYARQVVAAAEQIHKKVLADDPNGTKRLRYAKDALNRIAFKMGIALSESEIDALIEAAVWELNWQSTVLKEEKDGNQ